MFRCQLEVRMFRVVPLPRTRKIDVAVAHVELREDLLPALAPAPRVLDSLDAFPDAVEGRFDIAERLGSL